MSVVADVIRSSVAIVKGMKRTLSEVPRQKWTVQYPDEPVTVQPRYRGQHLLHVDEHGKEKCVACYLCAAACPSDCIYIEAVDDPRPYSERVGRDDFFLFGLTAEQAIARRAAGLAMDAEIAAAPALADAIGAIEAGAFSADDPARFRDITDALRQRDHFLVCPDFGHYSEAQRQIEARWRDPAAWWRSAIVNTAAMGYFSSDRAIKISESGSFSSRSSPVSSIRLPLSRSASVVHPERELSPR